MGKKLEFLEKQQNMAIIFSKKFMITEPRFVTKVRT